MVPLSRLLDASRLSVCIAITNESRRTVIRLTCHLLLSCLLYQLEFPTLLAMREIIASANMVRDFSPKPFAKIHIYLLTLTFFPNKLRFPKQNSLLFTKINAQQVGYWLHFRHTTSEKHPLTCEWLNGLLF